MKFSGKNCCLKGALLGSSSCERIVNFLSFLHPPLLTVQEKMNLVFHSLVIWSVVTPPVHFVTPKCFSILRAIALGSIKRATVLRDFWTDCYVPVTVPVPVSGGLELWKLRVSLILHSTQMLDSELTAFVLEEALIFPRQYSRWCSFTLPLSLPGRGILLPGWIQ